ncbi:MAG TPA: PatB family C-S lyase [Candidatus Wallbacteria bacterium]|nr:PatB family C-S lyase [Candidatus Wallbacteria bacterium]
MANLKYDFEPIINRKNTNCFKWDFAAKIFKSETALPMWVADMDFSSPPEIVNAIKERASHPIYGYAARPDSFNGSLIGWSKKRHGFEIKNEWICFSPGIVPALAIAVSAYTSPGDKVMIQTPVYPPFFSVVRDQKRELVENALSLENGHYSINFNDFEKKAASGVKLFMLCSPHNPVGRVWTREELLKIGEICLKYNIVIISDEIHSDIIYAGHKHICLASLSRDIMNKTVTLMSPSKTFNITGLAISAAIAADEKLRTPFKKITENLHIDQTNVFGVTAFEAAYKNGEAWLIELLAYLEGNIEYISEFLSKNLPEVKFIKPDGTFLAWLDFRKFDLPQKELCERITFRGGLALNDGTTFGGDGKGFMRLNFGCPRATLEEGMKRLLKAFK